MEQVCFFREKYCDNYLVKTITAEKGTKVKTYYHRVLEAKLVLGDKIVVSIDTEFIENESETVSKQDCEVTAAKRLLKRLAEDYPRLPVCIQGDNLYAAESVMKICQKQNWRYIFTHKAGRQKFLEESYEWIKQGGGTTEVQRICVEKGTGEFINHVEETAGNFPLADGYRAYKK